MAMLKAAFYLGLTVGFHLVGILVPFAALLVLTALALRVVALVDRIKRDHKWYYEWKKKCNER